jgi:hypothetical protein
MKMSGHDLLSKAIAAHWRAQGFSTTSDQWAGVVSVRDCFRVIISRNACEYRFQEWDASHSRWGPARAHSSLKAWANSFSKSDPDFAAGLLSLPDDATDAAAWLASLQGIEVPSSHRVRYWSAPDYAGVISTVGNLRSVVDRTGHIYAIQYRFLSPRDDGVRWITQAKGPSWLDLVSVVAPKTYDPDVAYQSRDNDKIALGLSDLFRGCPDLAADGPWPVLNVSPLGSDISPV